jgi:RimJ/RimL family protein N-acetyltransferase
MTSMNQWWPLAGLRLTTPRLELRVPTDQDLTDLADLAAGGIHDPDVQPFLVPWTEATPADRARGTLQYQWSQRARWQPSRWSLDLVVLHEGAVVGTQGISGADFAILREVATGSWLGQAHQGRGIGTEMRAAVLDLAFAGLGAHFATSGAFTDNLASQRVSRKLGYVDDGIERQVRRGQPATTMRLRLDRATWLATRTVPVEISGLAACLDMFGLGDEAASAEPTRP